MKKSIYIVSLILVAIIAVAAGFYIASRSSILTPNFTAAQEKKIEQITHDYLLKNPQVLVEVGKKLQEQEREEQKNQVANIEANVAKYKDRLFDTKAPGRLALGNPNGSIIAVEFTQHQCHHCKQATTVVDHFIKNNPDVQLVTIYWPFFGEDAIYTAKAVLAAQKQNKGEALNHAIFAYKDAVKKDTLPQIIKSIEGLNEQQLYKDMENQEYDSGLQANFKLAQDLGLIGTPALMFANKKMSKFSLVPGQSGHFEKDLEAALNKVRD